jgi:thiamine pyrophosphate-dependent acetolactate synthase large subunit-like protein
MTSREALKIIFSGIKNEPAVLATGYICRAAQAAGDRPQNFYMMGSMGLASSIGLGVALSQPKTKTLIVDGDGAVLMNLGTLPVVGALKPSNLIHIVIDNGGYESTGSQPSYTQAIALEKIAAASGYRYARRVSTASALRLETQKILSAARGPAFLVVKTKNDSGNPPARIKASPEEITDRFSKSLSR